MLCEDQQETKIMWVTGVFEATAAHRNPTKQLRQEAARYREQLLQLIKTLLSFIFSAWVTLYVQTLYFSRSTHKNSMILFDSRSLDTEALFKGHMRTARLSVCLEFSSLVGGWCHLLKIESGWRAFKDQQHPECRSPVFHQKTDHVISCNSGTAAGLVLAKDLNDRLRVSQVGGNKPELNAVNVVLTLILWSWTWCCSDCKAVWFYVRTQ